ncbi:hypothetical protein [Vibrio genomosp. F10]|uniref:hypothetical protein n=1 Tax=Vibrio genomosp. F10 TaxID=723171 RepID=UPI0003167CCF|nr:hypothetical protein [Vibrio genomosp. F10]
MRDALDVKALGVWVLVDIMALLFCTTIKYAAINAFLAQHEFGLLRRLAIKC